MSKGTCLSRASDFGCGPGQDREGHDFSRAVKTSKKYHRASAPEVNRLSWQTLRLFLPTVAPLEKQVPRAPRASAPSLPHPGTRTLFVNRFSRQEPALSVVEGVGILTSLVAPPHCAPERERHKCIGSQSLRPVSAKNAETSTGHPSERFVGKRWAKAPMDLRQPLHKEKSQADSSRLALFISP